jgi:molybdate transport system ATP-binding protein
MTALLRAQFEKRFPGSATIGVDIECPSDRSCVNLLFGRSGSGKTTVLRCLAGLERPEAGRITLGDDVWFDARRGVNLSPRRRQIGFCFQDYALFPHLNVASNISFGLGELPRVDRDRRVDELLSLLRIARLGQRFPRQLSGGQQQRVALARALARRPRLLLLDEPLAALDAPTRDELRPELRGLLTSLGVPVFVVSHDRVDVMGLADRVIVMEGGAVRQQGTLEEVFSRPGDADVACLVGIETIARGQVIEVSGDLATVEVGNARLVATANHGSPGAVFACIRGEDVLLQDEPTPRISARNCLPARVVSSSVQGPLSRITLDCGFALTAAVTRQSHEQLELREGKQVWAVIKAPAIHLVPCD